MEKIDLYFDIDGTMAYFNNNLECFEMLLEKNYFYNLTPIENVVQCINSLIGINEENINIYVLSSCINEDTKIQKDKWIDRYVPLLPKENRIYISLDDNKKDAVKNKENLNILIDDYNKNLNEFHDGNNFIGVKLVNDINDVKGTWKGERLFYNHSPFALMTTLKKIAFQETCRIYNISSLTPIEQRISHAKDKCENSLNNKKDINSDNHETSILKSSER